MPSTNATTFDKRDRDYEMRTLKQCTGKRDLNVRFSPSIPRFKDALVESDLAQLMSMRISLRITHVLYFLVLQNDCNDDAEYEYYDFR